MKAVPCTGLTLLLVGLICGCTGTTKTSELVTLKELNPTGSLPDRANLVLAGTKIPVDLTTRISNSEYSIELTAFGEILELERYHLESNTFSLIEVLGETYQPAMPILKTEMKLNSPWKWKGAISAAGIQHGAKADIFLSEDLKPAFPTDSKVWKVIATLQIDAGEETTAERVLSFYFVQGKGLLSREFGHASSRMPFEANLKGKDGQVNDDLFNEPLTDGK